MTNVVNLRMKSYEVKPNFISGTKAARNTVWLGCDT